MFARHLISHFYFFHKNSEKYTPLENKYHQLISRINILKNYPWVEITFDALEKIFLKNGHRHLTQRSYIWVLIVAVLLSFYLHLQDGTASLYTIVILSMLFHIFYVLSLAGVQC